jgi:hypothetical protein
VLNFPSSFFSRINHRAASLEDRLTKQTERYLQRLAKRERKLKRKLSKIDSTAAQKLFANSDQEYARMINRINSDSLSAAESKGASGQYVPYFDSLKTSLSFLSQNSGVLSDSKDAKEKIGNSLQQVNGLKSKLQQTDEVKAFIQQRKQQMREGLSKYTNLPKGISDELGGYSKEASYYSAQIKEYRNMLNDPDKMITKGLSLLNKVPAFTQFMQQHSELASLFSLPDNYGTPASLTGLQTRSMVQQQIQGQLASGGPNAQQYLQQNLQAAQSQLNTLKDRINKLGGSDGGDLEMPNFKPNTQKTKTFWQRLEYSSNMQTARSNYFYPTTTDLGLSVGYKLNDKSTIGVGASYKMGWGTNINHIALSNQGAGLRSFLDMKLKGSFYASGGFEYNYQPLTLTATTTAGTSGADVWQKSGLIGVSKIISIKSNFFKKTKLQLLWDFLSYQQVPKAQPVKFRVGYAFR